MQHYQQTALRRKPLLQSFYASATKKDVEELPKNNELSIITIPIFAIPENIENHL